MTSRTFTMKDQHDFAGLSGDFNPLHVDPMGARRLIFGGPVVHGVHLLLWAMEIALHSPVRLHTLAATFNAPVRVGDQVRCSCTMLENGTKQLQLHVDSRKVCSVEFTHSPLVTQGAITSGSPPRGRCREIEPSALPAAAGTLDLMADDTVLKASFPHLRQLLPADQIAVLLGSTRLIGMECPGLHSLYSELTLTFDESLDREPALSWHVRQFDARFARLLIDVAGCGANGTLVAFVRPKPVVQPSYVMIRKTVAPDAYRGQRALVVGGSRGMGEVCAKLLAAGGAEVRLTYARGSEDAARVVAEIADGNGRAAATPLNVLDPSSDVSTLLGDKWIPTHLYFFATPLIQPGTGHFSARLFAEYSSYYVDAFMRLIQAVRRLAPDGLAVFYPSTVYVDEMPRNFAEYAVAKAAGEAACLFLARNDPGLSILIERLPRVSTDQTATLLAKQAADPIAPLIRVLESPSLRSARTAPSEHR
jgi:hypothetical protein